MTIALVDVESKIQDEMTSLISDLKDKITMIESGGNTIETISIILITSSAADMEEATSLGANFVTATVSKDVI